MVMAPTVSWGGYLNSGEVGFGGPWVSAVSALVLYIIGMWDVQALIGWELDSLGRPNLHCYLQNRP